MPSPTTPTFNEHLADAYCFALVAGNKIQAEQILALDDRIPSMLIDKMCHALDTNNLPLVIALSLSPLFDINGYNENGDTPSPMPCATK